MPSKKANILNFNQHVKSNKMPHIIHTGLESLIKKIDGCGKNPQKS